MATKCYYKNALSLKTFKVDESIHERLEEICKYCKNLEQLTIGRQAFNPVNPDGSIWAPGQAELSDFDSEDESDSETDRLPKVDAKVISENLRRLKKLEIGTEFELKEPLVDPPVLDELPVLEDLRMSPLRPEIFLDKTRNERNLRILAQHSKNLKILDIRGCYLRSVLSLGWLTTQKLEALHVWYHVPATSVLSTWAPTLKYLTLARVNSKYDWCRGQGPNDPTEELNACLEMLGSCQRSKLQQLSLDRSSYSLKSLLKIVKGCRNLEYLDTKFCYLLPDELQKIFDSNSTIRQSFEPYMKLIEFA